MRRKLWIIYSMLSINHGIKPECFSSPTTLSLKGKRPGDINTQVFGSCPPSSFAHFTEHPICYKNTCFAPSRKPVSLNAFIFANNAVSTLQTARVSHPKGDHLKPGKTPNFACVLPLLRRNEIQTLCIAELGLWAQPVCVLHSGSNLLLLPRKNSSEVAGRKGCFPGSPQKLHCVCPIGAQL